MKAIKLLAKFLKEQVEYNRFPYNCWLNGNDMEVYVRKSVPRMLNDGIMYVTLDIANIVVKNKGKGHFTKFLAEVEQLNPWPAIYLENVLSPRLSNFLLKQGYVQMHNTYPSSFYKIHVDFLK